MTRPHRLLAAALCLSSLSPAIPVFAQTPPVQAAPSPVAEPRPPEAEFRAFQQAIDEYLRLQRRLRSETPALVVTADPRQIVSASNALAGAIQRARKNAKQGDMFDPTAARAVTERLRGVLQGADIEGVLATINDAPAFPGRPRVHMRFPEAWSMATMPAQLLAVLPPLPSELEYRLVGRDLILRDRDAALILDYVTKALPEK